MSNDTVDWIFSTVLERSTYSGRNKGIFFLKNSK